MKTNPGKRIINILLGITFPLITFAQIRGKITGSGQQPIEGATIILEQSDSTYIDATVSASDGTFEFSQTEDKYILIVQHLLYETEILNGRGQDCGSIQLRKKAYNIDEIVVKGERPLVRIENGRLCYDLSVLSQKQAVSNTYEAIGRLPGIQDNDGALSLAGAENLTIVMNGKPTTMTTEQLETLLRNTPIDRVEKAEIIYSAPPEMHVRGAVINVVMKRSNDYSLQGEVGAHYKNQYFNDGGANANLRFSTPKLAIDLMYSADNVKTMEYTDLYSKHTLPENIYNISQNEQLRAKYWSHNVRTAFEYNFNEKNHLDIAYTGSFAPDQHNNSEADGNFQVSNLDKQMNTAMNNVSVRYTSGFGLEVGGDYTRYTSDNNQEMGVVLKNGERESYTLNGGQRIDRYNVYADQKHNLNRNWSIGYGASFNYVRDHEFQYYDNVHGDIQTENTESHQDEQTTDFYLSINKSWGLGASLSLSATGEYYSMNKYKKWSIFPQASFTYMESPKHIFQLSLSTDKTYPSYWAMQSFVTHLNGYSELQGTPGLRPMTNYNLNSTYILKQKYIFGLFYTHTSDYFAQVPYQATDRLALVYKNINWNYMRMFGVNIIMPFNAGNWYDGRLTLVGMQARQKCDNLFDVPFDRTKWTFIGNLDNTFNVGKNLSFELNGNIQTPFIQGTFDLATSFNITAGMKWKFAKDKFTLTMRCNDIFNSSTPKMKVRFKGQYLNMDSGFYTRSVTMNIAYRFGDYKKKESKKVDTSRFGL